jgi:hypothetical protein
MLSVRKNENPPFAEALSGISRGLNAPLLRFSRTALHGYRLPATVVALPSVPPPELH